MTPRAEPWLDASASTFWDKATGWARRWPAELIWKLRRE
jgi:hypothetical protein